MIIHNNQLFPYIVGALMNSKFEFYLTGSRFFRTNQWHSDWDFFVTDCEDVRVFLRNIGFVSMEDPVQNYDDSTIVNVWTDNPKHSIRDGRIVQVQLVKDAVFKSKVQNALLSMYGTCFPTDKAKAKELWKLAVCVANHFSD